MRRIGIVNRGEAAVRFLDTLQALQAEGPGAPEAVALYTEPDADALFVRRAAFAAPLGPEPTAYLDAERVVQALRDTGCDAAWLGWGFASEDGDFCAALEAAGVTVLGPRPDTMRALGDKIRAKALAEAHGVPVTPWANVADVDQALREAARVGYPVLLKAAGGGGGRGIRRVDGPADLADALERARAEAQRSFRSDGILLERLVERARHVEVQILGDGAGRVLAFGVRDCSLQRRRQKVIEECPAPHLPAGVEAGMRAAAVRLGEAVRYRSAGTVEFLYDLERAEFYLLEVNTRLQVEHPVTELVFGVDLVRWQIDLARGVPLPAEVPAPRGWAVEARLVAEDPRNDFTPAPGRLVRFAPPTGAGLRIDTGFEEGDAIPAAFDALVAKLIAWAPTRAAALARLGRALARTRVVVEGGRTNLDFLRELVEREDVRAGQVETRLIDRMTIAPAPGAPEALVAAAIDRFLAAGDRLTVGADRHRVDAGRPLVVHRLGLNRFQVAGDEGACEVTWHPEGPMVATLGLGARAVRVERAPGDHHYLVDGVAHRVAAASAGAVVAPSVALVLDVFARPGDAVQVGQCLAILESMKMEVRVLASSAGKIREVRVGAGDQVRPGQVLAVVEAADAAAVAGPALPECPPAPGRAMARLTAALIGWDAPPAQFQADLAQVGAGPEALALLRTVADLAEAFERRPTRDRPGGGADAVSPDKAFETLRLRGPDALSPAWRERLSRALAHHGVAALAPSPSLHEALFRLDRARRALPERQTAAVVALRRVERAPVGLLDRLAALDPEQFGAVARAAERARARLFELPAAERLAVRSRARAGEVLEQLATGRLTWPALLDVPESLLQALAPLAVAGSALAAEAVARRLEWQAPDWAVQPFTLAGLPAFRVGAVDGPVVITCRPGQVAAVQAAAAALHTLRMEIVVCHAAGDALAAQLDALAPAGALPPGWRELCFLFVAPDDRPRVRRYRPDGQERPERRDILPTTSRRYDFKRLRDFHIERQPHEGEAVILQVTAKANPRDTRLLGYAEVRSLRRRRGRPLYLPDVDRVFHEAIRALEDARDRLGARRLHWNRLTLLLLPVVPLGPEVVKAYLGRLAPAADRIGLEKLVIRCRFATPQGPGPWQDLSVANPAGHRPEFAVTPASGALLRPRSRYASQVVAARRRGLTYPYEIVRILEGGGGLPPGRFEEFDLDPDGGGVSVGGRPRGENRAGVVFGILRARTPLGPLERVLVLSDPTRAMGALSQPECERVVAALDLADRLGLPLEWVAVSAGARIDWQTGTENLDWTARVLARIVQFTQTGGEINLLVPGICVGAQAYWNAEATMLPHTRGLLVMTARGAMVLTGKRALDASGCVSAADDLALGGYTAVMGPNGQAQAYAPDLWAAYGVLHRYYAHTYVPRGAGRPPHQATPDPLDRDIGASPYPAAAEHGFSTVGDLFSAQLNPDRKRPFAVRPVMAALADAEAEPVERWAALHGGETAVVWETRIGGYGCTLIGIDNQPVARLGQLATDGPDTFAGGTLYPQASRKVARAINAASGRRPVVVLANLSGFDGSPESLARWQLEYGAEIGRAVVNCGSEIIFVVLSRYHGGAYVVFSQTLNPRLTTVALSGSYASVIGGAPAAAVVFAGEVRRRTAEAGGGAAQRAQITAELAARFDGIHTVERAREVGSVDHILSPAALRPFVVHRLARDHAQHRGHPPPPLDLARCPGSRPPTE